MYMTSVGMGQSCNGASVHGVSGRRVADPAARRHDDDVRTHLVQVVAAWWRQ